MNLGKGLAIFVSVIFFFVLTFIFLAVVNSLFPGYSFSNNPIIRLISLLTLVFLTKRFYIYLRGKSYD